MRAAVLNPPPGYLRKLDPLPDGTKIRSRPAKDRDGILWVAYPKGGKTKAVTDLPATPWWKHRDVLGEITGEKGYRPVAFAKIDETWTTLRFRKSTP